MARGKKETSYRSYSRLKDGCVDTEVDADQVLKTINLRFPADESQ